MPLPTPEHPDSESGPEVIIPNDPADIVGLEGFGGVHWITSDVFSESWSASDDAVAVDEICPPRKSRISKR